MAYTRYSIYAVARKKGQRKKSYSGKLTIRPDHPRCPIEIPFGVVDVFPVVVISLKFHQHRLIGYRAVRVEIWLIPLRRPWAYITAVLP